MRTADKQRWMRATRSRSARCGWTQACSASTPGRSSRCWARPAPQRVPLAPHYIAGVMPYRGDVLTTVSFRVLLGLETGTRQSCILVLDSEQTEEVFGLMVDGVAGVVTMAKDALEANPSALDARSMALFDGAYKLPSGLMVRLDPQRLRPSRLAESGLFGSSERPHGSLKQVRRGNRDESADRGRFQIYPAAPAPAPGGHGHELRGGRGRPPGLEVLRSALALRLHAAGCEHAGDERPGVREGAARRRACTLP